MSEIRNNAKKVKDAFIRSKYIDAAKTIILRDGVHHVTVRGIADITGYSYPMVYRYFQDLNELLLETKLSMINEMRPADKAADNQHETPLECKKREARQTAGFFIDHPNIFVFFYQYPLDANNALKMRSLALESAYYDDFLPFVTHGRIRKEDIPAIARAITLLVFGAVTLYLSDNGLTRDEALESIDNAIELLLKGYIGNEEE